MPEDPQQTIADQLRRLCDCQCKCEEAGAVARRKVEEAARRRAVEAAQRASASVGDETEDGSA